MKKNESENSAMVLSMMIGAALAMLFGCVGERPEHYVKISTARNRSRVDGPDADVAGHQHPRGREKRVAKHRRRKAPEQELSWRQACAWGDIAALERMRKNGTRFDDPEFLCVAAKHGQLECCKYLIAHGADVNGRDRRDSTALHHAATSLNPAICEFLISSGADVNARDNNGTTVLHYAALFGTLEVCEFLIGHGATAEDQIFACRDDAIRKLLLENGAKSAVIARRY